MQANKPPFGINFDEIQYFSVLFQVPLLYIKHVNELKIMVLFLNEDSVYHNIILQIDFQNTNYW